jgi:hypothetical protein
MHKRTLLSVAIASALAASTVAVAGDDDGYRKGSAKKLERKFDIGRDGEYRTGDFHNHTTCSDGSTSVRTLTRKALEQHDWFIHVGHSGRGPRDCRVNDFLYHAEGGGDRVGLWSHTIGPDKIKGDKRTREIDIRTYDADTGAETEITQTVQDMWRWQSLQEFNMDNLVEARELPGYEDKVAFLGLEWVVPGHEHASNAFSSGQFDDVPNSDAIAQFEYCFARNSDDTSQGGGQGWTCEISEENNEKLKALFAGRPEEGIADYNSTLVGGINTEDSGEHVKAAAATLWKQENFPNEGIIVQAHVERQGAFIEDDDEGWNVEHMRDMNSLAPEVAIGFESQPGHQAQRNRGSYNPGRPTAGLWTYGGTGAYGAAEVSKPGLNFDGTPITVEQASAVGYGSCDDGSCDTGKVVLSRPGVRTMWDAMLSEGRKFWFFASSDWHNRGSFGPTEPESTNDFWPGEYQDNFVFVKDENPDNPAQDIIDGLRSGNVFTVQGQLIDKMKFVACSEGKCATMGETLPVRKGAKVEVQLVVRDPEGKNLSPYSFNNPVLKQIGVDRPINEPELTHVELIKGEVSGIIPAIDPEYYNPLAPETTKIVKQVTGKRLGRGEVKEVRYSFRANTDSYIRARGSNLPPGTPNARDADGNPLADNLKDNIACDDPLCPPHVNGIVDYGLEAWTDVWFHSNPIFIDVQDGKRKHKPKWDKKLAKND